MRFCHEVGLDYVSCSPYRVPIARLGAAQAALAKEVVDDGVVSAVVAPSESDDAIHSCFSLAGGAA